MKTSQPRAFRTPSFVGLAFLQLCLAAGTSCAAQPDQASSGPPAASGGTMTLETPVQTIAANPKGKMVLDRDLPGFTTDPNYPIVKVMSLNQLATMSDGKITEAQLAQLKADLAAIPAVQVTEQ